MDHSIFITLAYGATAVLLAALVASSVRRARRARRLTARDRDEA